MDRITGDPTAYAGQWRGATLARISAALWAIMGNIQTPFINYSFFGIWEGTGRNLCHMSADKLYTQRMLAGLGKELHYPLSHCSTN